MNIIHVCILFFTLFIIAFSPQANATSTKSISAYMHQKEKKLLSCVHILNNITYTTLIQIMHELENHLEYWATQSKNPQRFAIVRGPKALLSSQKTAELIHEHITELRITEKLHAEALGKIHILRQTKEHSLFDYCKKSLEILSSLMPISYHKFNSVNDQDTLNKLQAGVAQALIKMQTYKKRFDEAIAIHAKPSHLVRNWLKYLIGAIALSTAGYMGYKHRKALSSGYNEAIKTLKLQWQKRIVEPIKGIINNISSKMPDDITQKNKNLDLKEEAIKLETEKYYNRRNDIDEKNVNKYVQEFMNGNEADITHDLGNQMRNISQNVASDASSSMVNSITTFFWKPKEGKPNFRLPETVRQWSLIYELKFNKKEREINQWQQLQEINLLLGAMFPAALALYGIYKLSNAAFNSLFFKKIVLMPLQERILLVRRMLNRLDNGTTTELSLEAQGHLVYWTEKLKQYIIQLPQESQDNFKQDILELASIHINTKQKHEVVKRMYEVYSFLQPTKS